MTQTNDTQVLAPRRGDTTRLLTVDAILAGGRALAGRGDTTRLLAVDAVLAASRSMTRLNLEP